MFNRRGYTFVLLAAAACTTRAAEQTAYTHGELCYNAIARAVMGGERPENVYPYYTTRQDDRLYFSKADDDAERGLYYSIGDVDRDDPDQRWAWRLYGPLDGGADDKPVYVNEAGPLIERYHRVFRRPTHDVLRYCLGTDDITAFTPGWDEVCFLKALFGRDEPSEDEDYDEDAMNLFSEYDFYNYGYLHWGDLVIMRSPYGVGDMPRLTLAVEDGTQEIKLFANAVDRCVDRPDEWASR